MLLSTVSEVWVHHPQLHSEAGCAGEKTEGQRLLASLQLRSRKNACALGFLILFHEGPRPMGYVAHIQEVLPPLVNPLWNHTQTHPDMCFTNLSASCSTQITTKTNQHASSSVPSSPRPGEAWFPVSPQTAPSCPIFCHGIQP